MGHVWPFLDENQMKNHFFERMKETINVIAA
jgi:hypothetical protein